jgi:hypothetical protein
LDFDTSYGINKGDCENGRISALVYIVCALLAPGNPGAFIVSDCMASASAVSPARDHNHSGFSPVCRDNLSAGTSPGAQASIGLYS